MFEIIRIIPAFCPITDGCIGSRAERLPVTCQSEAFSKRLAGHLEAADRKDCGDASFQVVRVGQCPFRSG